MSKLKIANGALDDLEGNIVLRGVIDPTTFDKILAGRYQREEAQHSHIMNLMEALKQGSRFPDIEIGIRGSNYRDHQGIFHISHDCYVVDGLQRLTAAKLLHAEDPLRQIHLGALLHFGTTEEWERKRFKTLNTDRARVSANVLLRNEVSSSVVKALRAMTETDREFVLRGKIAWNQSMKRDELLGAVVVMKVIGVLHSHFGPGVASRVEDLVVLMDRTFNIVGSNVWRANVKTFFSVLDQAYGLRSIAYRGLSPHIKGGFLFTLARIFADHETFWDGHRLVVAKNNIDKLRTFPINDPGILQVIANSNSKSNPMLIAHLLHHINSGRRTRRLMRWGGQPSNDILMDDGCTSSDDVG